MKVPAVNLNVYNNIGPNQLSNKSSVRQNNEDVSRRVDDLSSMPYVYPITFTSFANSSKLRQLFAYDLPCMYSGLIMIDPKVLSRLQKNGIFFRPAQEVLAFFDRYKDSFTGMEKKLIDLIRERSAIHPDKNLKELLEEIEPFYRRDLRKTQAPIFMELSVASNELPYAYKIKFDRLMKETDNKLNERPVIIPFSSYEFKYRLAKIQETIANGATPKEIKVLKKIMKESKRLSNITNDSTIDNQKKVIRLLDHILKKSVLKDNLELNNLMDLSKSRLLEEKIVVPFSRKTFMYDLAKILEDLPDENLRNSLMSIAEKLPTSSESFSAYVLKITAEPADKIGHRLLWPSLASVEHLHPKSEGGLDMLSNYGGARTVINSQRKSIPLKEWIEFYPETRKNCQKYLDRLIELYSQGLFQKLNIDPKYIYDFTNTIEKESEGTLKLSLKKLHEAKFPLRVRHEMKKH